MPTTSSDITLASGVRGTLVQPDARAPMPAVLMLHGFASQRHEVGDMFARLAEALAVRGIASLRIDFRGWGESAGAMMDSTLDGQVEDARAAYAALRKQPFVDGGRIGVVGFSMGGTIACLLAGDAAPQSLVLWSATQDILTAMLDELGEENAETAARDGHVTVDLGWRSVTLGHGFFESLARADIHDAYARYTGALLVVAGTEDSSAASLDGFREDARGALRASYLVPSADHIFNTLSGDLAISNDVIAKTAAWLALTLAGA
jgi:uncharacterized protein